VQTEKPNCTVLNSEWVWGNGKNGWNHLFDKLDSDRMVTIPQCNWERNWKILVISSQSKTSEIPKKTI
jgi:hypothetical protein